MRNWKLLLKNKCPDCKRDLLLAFVEVSLRFECKCGFKIGTQRLTEITSSMVSGRIERDYAI